MGSHSIELLLEISVLLEDRLLLELLLELLLLLELNRLHSTHIRTISRLR